MITVKSIDPKEHRYPTCGDWWTDEEGTLQIRVSNDLPEHVQFLYALHEIVEANLCILRGVTDEAVTKHDVEFEESGKEGEPGDDPGAPYRREHRFAMLIEHLMAFEMVGIDYGRVE